MCQSLYYPTTPLGLGGALLRGIDTEPSPHYGHLTAKPPYYVCVYVCVCVCEPP